MSKQQTPNVLFLDIETAPILAHVWGLFNNDVGLNQIISDWHLMSFSAKWEGSEEIEYADVSDQLHMENDYALLVRLRELLDAADIVVAHNGRKFDIKKINARFLEFGISPPSPYQIVDTLEVVKKHFGFTSNKLAFLTSKLCKKHKKITERKYAGHILWLECQRRNDDAWREMREYNMMDVLSLEEFFNVLRPWISQLNYGVYAESPEPMCPKCGSKHIIFRGYRKKLTGEYARFRCSDCGGWGESRFARPKSSRKELIKGS